MEDDQIVELYWARSETAISETAKKYGKYCRSVAYSILRDDGDSEECVNDTYMGAWNSMPPHRPAILRTFLGRITRNLSLKRCEERGTEKRGFGQMPLALDELTECLPAPASTESVVDELVLAELLDRFLAGLPAEQRKFFIRRYWYLSSIKEIAAEYRASESKVKMSLLRSRSILKRQLEKEGILL